MDPASHSPTALKPVAWWQLWSNPIFRRYRRSELRPARLAVWCLSILIFTLFFFLLVYLGGQRAGVDKVTAARMTLIPTLAIQALVMMILGTTSTTLGYVREAHEGVTEYQRLTPSSPLAKVLGFLFGLPVRCYALFLLTVPFTLFAAVIGKIEPILLVRLYAVFLMSAILYHLTGLLAGTVVKQRLLAGMIATSLVITINTVLPFIMTGLGKGYAFLTHLTIWPVAMELFFKLGSETGPAFVEFAQNTGRTHFSDGVQLYHWEIPNYLFSLFVQSGLILVFLVIIHRRWRDENHHLLGKHFSIFVCGGVLFLFLGTVLPIIHSGMIFPTLALKNRGTKIIQDAGLSASPTEAWALVSFTGLFTFQLASLIVGTITPSRERLLQGMRRARKLGQRGPSLGSDPATSFWHVSLIGLACGTVWWFFAQTLFNSSWTPDHSLPGWALPMMLFSFMIAVVGFWAILEGRSKGGGTWIYLLLVWIVPLMISGILGVMRLPVAAIYALTPSTPAAFFSISGALLNLPSKAVHLHISGYFWLFLNVFLVLFFLARRWTTARKLRAQVAAEVSDPNRSS